MPGSCTLDLRFRGDPVIELVTRLESASLRAVVRGLGTLSSVEEAMMRLAASIPRRDLAARAYELYESFRPRIPSGIRGWGAAGDLDLERVARLRRTQEAE